MLLSEHFFITIKGMIRMFFPVPDPHEFADPDPQKKMRIRIRAKKERKGMNKS